MRLKSSTNEWLCFEATVRECVHHFNNSCSCLTFDLYVRTHISCQWQKVLHPSLRMWHQFCSSNSGWWTCVCVCFNKSSYMFFCSLYFTSRFHLISTIKFLDTNQCKYDLRHQNKHWSSETMKCSCVSNTETTDVRVTFGSNRCISERTSVQQEKASKTHILLEELQKLLAVSALVTSTGTCVEIWHQTSHSGSISMFLWTMWRVLKGRKKSFVKWGFHIQLASFTPEDLLRIRSGSCAPLSFKEVLWWSKWFEVELVFS